MEFIRWTGAAALPKIIARMKCLSGIAFRTAALLVAGWMSLAGTPMVAAERSAAEKQPPPSASPRRPNIVLIVADDLGYGDLGCYGQSRIKTPNLDQLAAEGIRFTSFYSGSTVCAPSRCALMTGLHTGHARIRGNAAVPLLPEDVTVAKVLKESGYATGLVGKWGLGNPDTTGVPQKQGFDEFIGYLDQTHAHDYYTDQLWRYDFRAAHEKTNWIVVFPENQGGKHGTYMHDLFTTAALNYVRINKPDRVNKYRPFFLFLAYTIPHANNEETRRSGNGMQVPSDGQYAGESWPQPEKNKAAMITRLDADVGRLLAQLKQLGIDGNTVIFFTSDNGPHKEGGGDPKFFQSSGPFRGIKRDLYEGGIRVPMIVRWPDQIRGGQVSDQVWAMWDFLPTAAEIAQAQPRENIDGISMAPTLLGQRQTNQHAFLYWEFHERGFQQAARKGEWKAVSLDLGKPPELYNLKTDPGEKENVAAQNPKLADEMGELLKTARTPSEHWPIKPPPGAGTEIKPRSGGTNSCESLSRVKRLLPVLPPKAVDAMVAT